MKKPICPHCQSGFQEDGINLIQTVREELTLSLDKGICVEVDKGEEEILKEIYTCNSCGKEIPPPSIEGWNK